MFNVKLAMKKFKKMGAVIEDNTIVAWNQEWKATFNGKSVYFDESSCYSLHGYDDANQEAWRSFYDNPTQAVKWLRRD